MTVLKHEDLGPEEFGVAVTRVGGADDGEEFRMVKAEMSDGTINYLWVCNTREGYFKQVFVPWDD